MNRYISAMLEQRHFQFLRKQTFWQRLPFLRQRRCLQLVSRRLNDLQLESEPWKSCPALSGDGIGLSEGKSAASGCDGYGLGGWGHVLRVACCVFPYSAIGTFVSNSSTARFSTMYETGSSCIL